MRNASFSLNQARSEELLLKTYSIGLPKPVHNISDLSPDDDVSMEILRKFHPVTLENYTPISIIGDGNGLFRAVSKGVFSTQEHYMMLRLLTALEFIFNRKYYDVEAADYVDLFPINKTYDGYDGDVNAFEGFFLYSSNM